MATHGKCDICGIKEKCDEFCEENSKKFTMTASPYGGAMGAQYYSKDLPYKNKELYGDDRTRVCATNMTCLFRGSDKMNFHKFKADAILTFISGHPFTLYVIDPDSKHMKTTVLNRDNVVETVKRGCWYGGQLIDASDHCYSFTFGLNVPGVFYDDAIYAKAEELLAICPDQKDVISQLTAE